MIRLVVYLTSLLLMALIILYGSIWLFGGELMQFGVAVWVMIKSFAVSLGKLTWSGVFKYISAQAARFFTVEWWKYFVVKWIKKSALPFIFGTILGEKIAKALDRFARKLRVYRWYLRRWFSQQPKAAQVFYWLISGIIITALTLYVIGFGVIAFAFQLPVWLVSLFKTLFLKIWVIIQRAVFRTLMFFFTHVIVWRQAQRWLKEHQLKRLERVSGELKTKPKKIARHISTKGSRILRRAFWGRGAKIPNLRGSVDSCCDHVLLSNKRSQVEVPQAAE